jgi:hypothetical protein
MPIISTAQARFGYVFLALSLSAVACGSNDEMDSMSGPGALAAHDPDAATEALVDRFSAEAGMLQVRSAANGLPAAGAAIDFDQEPFITRGLGPSGERVAYYNFDVKSTVPAPIYVLVREGETDPVSGQLNVIDVKPGDAGYNDFWQVTQVTVPADYVANSITHVDEITAAGYALSTTSSLVNCPVVPNGSTADLRLGSESEELHRGWYKGEVVYYFSFDEHVLTGSTVPLAPIFVTFNINPDLEGGGPPSGFRAETGTNQTHNVVSVLPSQADYSPLWAVSPYDNADFDDVTDLATVNDANVLANGVANVNCPIVEIGQ